MAKDDLIILTGGAGFIGSCFLWKLNAEGKKNIVVVDHFGESAKWKNLNGKTYVDYLEKDAFLNEYQAGKYDKKVKAIFHIGACSSTTEQNATYLLKNNYEYSKILAERALKNNIPFYYASSAATYGDGSKGYSDEDANTYKLEPLNMYGFSKQLFDLWLLRRGLANKVVGFKYFNVFGPNEYHKGEMRSLVAKAYQQVKKEKKISLFKSYKPEYKNGEQKRDFIYVKDAVEVMWQFYKNPKMSRGIYNLGTGKARTWNDLAGAIFSALAMKPNIEYIEMPKVLQDKYQYFTEADLKKLNNVLPYTFSSLEDAVADYVKNYLERDFACL